MSVKHLDNCTIINLSHYFRDSKQKRRVSRGTKGAGGKEEEEEKISPELNNQEMRELISHS